MSAYKFLVWWWNTNLEHRNNHIKSVYQFKCQCVYFEVSFSSGLSSFLLKTIIRHCNLSMLSRLMSTLSFTAGVTEAVLPLSHCCINTNQTLTFLYQSNRIQTTTLLDEWKTVFQPGQWTQLAITYFAQVNWLPFNMGHATENSLQSYCRLVQDTVAPTSLSSSSSYPTLLV